MARVMRRRRPGARTSTPAWTRWQRTRIHSPVSPTWWTLAAIRSPHEAHVLDHWFAAAHMRPHAGPFACASAPRGQLMRGHQVAFLGTFPSNTLAADPAARSASLDPPLATASIALRRQAPRRQSARHSGPGTPASSRRRPACSRPDRDGSGRDKTRLNPTVKRGHQDALATCRGLIPRIMHRLELTASAVQFVSPCGDPTSARSLARTRFGAQLIRSR